MTNSTPTQMMSGNLRWMADGSVWADWILQGLPYGLEGIKQKRRARDAHVGLLRSLLGESLLLGLCADVDPGTIVQRMLDGVDAKAHPDWIRECQATLDSLGQVRPGERVYWLSVPLASDSSKRWTGAMRAHLNVLRTALGLKREVPSSEEVTYYEDAARRVWEKIPPVFGPRRATVAQMVWLHEHLMHRGLRAELDVPEPGALALSSGSALSRPWVDEAGVSDLENKQPRTAALANRYVKVRAADDPSSIATYQAQSLIASVPSDGFAFPGGEMLGRLDQAGLYTDWAMRLSVTAGASVAADNDKALRNLNEQYLQREGEVSTGTSVLDVAAASLAEYSSTLQNDKLEVECQATMILSVAAATPDLLRPQQEALAGYISDAGYKLAQPVGFQEQLWWAFHPGTRSTGLLREFAQVTTSRDLACLVPFTSSHLGDRDGILLGLNLANGPLLADDVPCGPTSSVMWNPAGSKLREASGSIAITGDLGSGKSYLIKKITGSIIDRGGLAVIVDRTQMGEYEMWAESVTDTVVADIAHPKVSLDPLRLFGPGEGARIAQSFLTPLLNMPVTSPEGVLLSEVLEPGYLAARQMTALGDLLEHLLTNCDLPGASEVGRKLAVFARKDIGRIIFDSTLPPLEGFTTSLVIRTHKVQLPRRAELENQHLFAQLSLEKIFGRAFYALIADLARAITFADQNRLAAFVADETHGMTISSEAEAANEDLVRDGRKHAALAVFGSQDASDFGSQTLRGLIPTRVLMRHRDRHLAVRGLEFLDLNPTDDLVDLVTKDTSPLISGQGVPRHRRGEMLMRDAYGRVGRGKILAPYAADRAAAASTSSEDVDEPPEQVPA